MADSNDIRAIAARLKNIQKYYGYTNEKMANTLHISVSSYDSICTGKRMLSDSVAIALVSKLKVNLNYLYYGIEDSQMILPSHVVDQCTEDQSLRRMLESFNELTIDEQMMKLKELRIPLVELLHRVSLK